MWDTVHENGCNPDIVSVFSCNARITLATEACQEKRSEIKTMPLLLATLYVSGHIVASDAMAMQKDIVDAIRKKDSDLRIELKADQKALSFGMEA